MIDVGTKGVPDLLNDALDRMNGTSGHPEPAASVAASLDRDAVYEAALVHLSGLLEAEPRKVVGNQISIAGLSLRLVQSDDPTAPIRYDDIGAGFTVEGVALERADGPRNLTSLLFLLQCARDRSDTLLYHPSEVRAEYVQRLAEETGASERFVRQMLGRSRALSTVLEV